MIRLVVVENPKRWPFEIEGAEVVSARAYLVDRKYSELRRAAVFNMCRRYGYQTVGYYVSLLAAARGHRPLPSVETLQALTSTPLIRIASVELDELIQKSLSHLRSEEFRLSIYFGRNVAQRYDRLSRALFNQFPAPFLVCRFTWEDDRWLLAGIRPGAAAEIPDGHREFVLERAKAYFLRPARQEPKTHAYRFDLAVLWSPDDPQPPSNEKAIKKFVKAANRHGIGVDVIGPEDLGRVAEFDALFIRQTTQVNHVTYRFASRAAAQGLVVIDDPVSIVRCTNKVYQAELFDRHQIPCPRTLVVHEANVEEVAGVVGLPCVLKKPDGAFSSGVVKVSTREELQAGLEELFRQSELVVAQEYMPSSFDWRIGVLDGRALFACRYHMAKGHWQIAQRVDGDTRYGRVEAVELETVPPRVLDVGVRAASLMGEGLYGVDLKEVDGRVVVMEVNDNPNLDAGNEDGVLKDALYDELAAWFLARLDRRGRDRRGA